MRLLFFRFWLLVGVGVRGYTNLLPGVTPNHFETRERVPLMVSAVTSTKTQIPYESRTLPHCTKSYELLVKVPQSCKVLCTKKHSRAEMRLFRALIDNEYRLNWSLDGLPAASKSPSGTVTRGFPVGFALVSEAEEQQQNERRHFLYNHVRLAIHYHEDGVGARIVGFFVEPFSLDHSYIDDGDVLGTCNEQSPAVHDPSKFQTADEVEDVIYTYDVHWLPSDVEWSARWDAFLNASQADSSSEIHYFSIVNSFMIVIFLTGVVAVILLRTLKRDISHYNDDGGGGVEEESGWKLVHGDVFRPPQKAGVLCVFVAAGVHLLAATLAVCSLALGGFLSPANRANLGLGFAAAFLLFQVLNGYVASRFYTFFFLNDADWLWVAVASASFYPAVLSLAFVGIAALLKAQGSTPTTAWVGGVDAYEDGKEAYGTRKQHDPFSSFFKTALSAVLLFVGLAAPLAGLGASYGASVPRILPPVRISKIQRPLPAGKQRWYAHPLIAILFGGVLPFGAVCVELFFVMSALWLRQIYYLFGFLVVVLLILIATCAEITIVLCYLQLCNEDYRWWWRAFLSSGSAALYLFLYSVWYFHAKLDIQGLAPTVLYFAYMAIVAFSFFLTTGAIGLVAAFAFNLTIYAAIKVD